MNNEFQNENRSKPRFIFDDEIKIEPDINEELEITPVIDSDAVKTEQDELNQSEENNLNFPIETQLNFPIENQANVLKTYARNKAKITKHYTTSTSKNSDNLTVPKLIENSLPNETQPVEIKIETIEQIDVKEHMTFKPIAEVDVKENTIFEPFEGLDITENIVKTEENVVKQPHLIEPIFAKLTENIVKTEENVVKQPHLIEPIFAKLTENIVKTEENVVKQPHLIEPIFAKLTENIVKTEENVVKQSHLIERIFAKPMPKTAQKPGRKRLLKHTCIFCDKKFTSKCKMYEHMKTHNLKKPSCKCVHRALNVHVKPPRGAPFACNLCKLVTCTRADLKRHIVKFHNMKSEVYKCHHCQSSFPQKDHLIAHLKLQSNDYTSPYKCSNATYKLYDYDTYLTKAENNSLTTMRFTLSRTNMSV